MSLSVLLIDDSPIMRKMIKRALGIARDDVGEYLEAGDGEEALKLLRDAWVDLVLADINMPNMNGVQLMEQMSRDPLLKRIPVIVVSTERSEQRIQYLYELGIRGYLPKPFTPEALRDAVTTALEKSRA